MKRWFTIVLVGVLVIALAAPAVAVGTSTKTGAPRFVSHPYTKKSTLELGKDFAVWGYVRTFKNRPISGDASVTIEVQRWKSKHSWEASSGLTASTMLSATGKFRNKTNYTATMDIGAKGRYRLRAVLVWHDSKGDHRMRSSWKYIRVEK